MADVNIYSLLMEDEQPTQSAAKPVKSQPQPPAKTQSRPTTQQSVQSNRPKKDFRNRKPAPVKDGAFEEKPDHKNEGRGQRFHKYEKPAHGRSYDRRSQSHPVKGGEKKEVVGASWGDEVEAQLATAEGEVTEPVVGFEEEEQKPKTPEPEENFKSLADYLKEKATLKAASDLAPRPANDGKEDPKWKKLTEVTKEVDEFVPAKVQQKEKKQKEVKQKVVLEIEQTFAPVPREGRPNSGKFKGKQQRDGPREPRENAPRNNGGQRNGKGNQGQKGGRDSQRGRGKAPVVNVNDQEAFPSLA